MHCHRRRPLFISFSVSRSHVLQPRVWGRPALRTGSSERTRRIQRRFGILRAGEAHHAVLGTGTLGAAGMAFLAHSQKSRLRRRFLHASLTLVFLRHRWWSFLFYRHVAAGRHYLRGNIGIRIGRSFGLGFNFFDVFISVTARLRDNGSWPDRRRW